MTRWLVNNFASWQLAVITLGLCAVVVLAGLALARRAAPHPAEGRSNEGLAIIIGVVAAVYGILLAFVVIALYEELASARSNVAVEATALAQVLRDTQVLPRDVHEGIESEVVAYATAVRTKEWEEMRHGRASSDAWQHLSDLYHALQGYSPRTEAEKIFYGQAQADLNALVAARRQRLDQAARELPGEFQALLAIGAFVLIASICVIGFPESRIRVSMLYFVAVLIAFSLLLAIILDHPFSGDVAVSSAPFSEGELQWRPPRR